MSQSCCLVYFLICSIQFTVADVFFNSSCKQVSILKYDSQRTSQVILLNLGNVDSIVTDFTFLNIIETVDQICDRCLSCTCGTYESKFLSRLGEEADVFQNNFVRVISECNIFESDISCQFCISNGAICRMWMFPCPHACSLFAFCDIAVGILSCINKFYVTFILFRLLVNEPEDTFCTCKCHNNGIKLLCHLHEWLGKALGEL